MDIKEAKEQIKEAHKQRAVIYYYLYDEIEKALGREEAVKLFKRATYRRGKDIQKKYKNFMKNKDFAGIADFFCNNSPSDGELFKPKIEKVEDNRAVMYMEACPLVEAWKDMGLADEVIELMCEVSSAIDYGTFESDNTQLEFTHKIASKEDKCRLIIQGKK